MTRAEKTLALWAEKAGRLFDDLSLYNTPDFIYDNQPEAVYFTADLHFLYVLPGYEILTAFTSGQNPRRKPGLHRFITEQKGTVAKAEKGTHDTGTGKKTRLVRLTTQDGKTAFIRPKYYDTLPANAKLYVEGPRNIVVCGIWTDAGKLEIIAGIMPIQAAPEYFTPDAPKAPAKEA